MGLTDTSSLELLLSQRRVWVLGAHLRNEGLYQCPSVLCCRSIATFIH